METDMQKIEIRIRGQLDRDWSDWLGGLAINHTRQGETIMTGSVRDQSATIGLLSRLSGMGLQIVSLAAEGAHARSSKEAGKM
jgi:hypothetical protein